MSLSNDKQIHQIILKLDKDIPRERALRLFLDNASLNGINRKEAILRIFEEYSDSNPFKMKRENINHSREEIIDGDKKEDIETIKANKRVFSASEFEE